MTPEDIGDIFQELEDALFAMAIRNMDAHKAWEEKEGFKWTQWQAEQIKGLRQYREKVNLLTNKGFDRAKKGIERFLQEAYEGSVNDAAGFAVKAGKGSISPAFFGVNSQKMDIMLEEAVKDIDTKRYACINRMNSGYTDFLRKADIFAQSGSMTIPQALDHAMKDFLSAGLNCVEYSNGNRVNIASYAEMALRTSSSEVTRQANGDVRNALDEYLVVSNVIGMTCPICQKWQGKVLIDDVYSDGKPDGKHQLVSDAKADGFMHPNCRHQLYMYLEGITEISELPNDVETKEHYKAEQEQRRQEREIRKYKRLRDGAVDPENKKKYAARVKEWTAKHDQFLQEHDYLRKNPQRLAPGYTGNGKPTTDIPKITQKISDRMISFYGSPETMYTHEEIENALLSSDIGVDMARYLEDNGYTIELYYDHNDDLAGRIDGKTIVVNPFNNKDEKEISATIIHEACHERYNWNKTMEDEVNCRIMEYLHLYGSISDEEIRYIVRLVKQYYSDWPEGNLYGFV